MRAQCTATALQAPHPLIAACRYYAELLGAGILPVDWSGALQIFRESTTGTISGITRWSDHIDDMPSSYYVQTALREGRLSSAWMMGVGHAANYMGRGTLSATEQLSQYADASGYYREYLSDLERGVDDCVPTILQPAEVSLWNLVLPGYDDNTVYLGRGIPPRYCDPAGSGVSVAGALTRHGIFNLTIVNAAVAGGNQTSTATLTYTPGPWWAAHGYPTGFPVLAVKLQPSDPALTQVVPGSVVVVSGPLTIQQVQLGPGATPAVTVTLIGGSGASAVTAVVQAMFAPGM